MAFIEFSSASDKIIEAVLGERFRALRLRHNMTQQELADAAAVSLGTIKALEAGRGKIATVIAVLRELRALEELNAFIPEPGISPIQLARSQGKPRQRASGERIKRQSQDKAEW